MSDRIAFSLFFSLAIPALSFGWLGFQFGDRWWWAWIAGAITALPLVAVVARARSVRLWVIITGIGITSLWTLSGFATYGGGFVLAGFALVTTIAVAIAAPRTRP